MPNRPLSQTASVTLDASGNGTASLGPLSAREVWHPENAHVQVSSNTNEATCSIYVGDSPAQRNFRDQTFSGSSGDSTDKVNASVVRNPNRVFASWSGGDAHAQASLTVTGTVDV